MALTLAIPFALLLGGVAACNLIKRPVLSDDPGYSITQLTPAEISGE